jgi:transposase-like protein
MIQKPWETHWEDLVEFFKYSEEIRKIIYITNAIESMNFSLRKATKNRAALPTDESIYKIMYLAINKASKK